MENANKESVLFIDACARQDSRTRVLAEYLVKKLGGSVEQVHLFEEDIPVMNEAALDMRNAASANRDFSNDYFRYAKQFAQADRIVIAAPYWDASFPAVLKQYVESICIVGLTFEYSPEGFPVGLCKAKELYYVTTAGGKIYETSYGYGYIEALSKQMLGIKECKLFAVEGLDIVGCNVDILMKNGQNEIDRYMDIHDMSSQQ